MSVVPLISSAFNRDIEDVMEDRLDMLCDGKIETTKLAAIEYAVKVSYREWDTTKELPIEKAKYAIVANKNIAEDKEVFLPLYGMPCQNTTVAKCLKFTDDVDPIDYYFVPVRAALTLTLSPINFYDKSHIVTRRGFGFEGMWDKWSRYKMWRDK